MFFEGASFLLRAKGAPKGNAGLDADGLAWEDFLRCQGLGLGIGTDCFGAAMPAVRYDSPTWGGFRFETSWGTNTLTPFGTTPDSNFWDIAAFYTADWNSIKLSAAAAYTWQENGNLTGDEDNLWQAGASIMHKPSGLGVYAMGQWERPDGANVSTFGIDSISLDSITISNPPPNLNIDLTFTGLNGPAFVQNNPDTDVWYIKPFWRKVWGSMNGVGLGALGATTFFGEYGQYNDQFAAGTNLCSFTTFAGSNLGNFCAPTPTLSLGGGLITASYVPGDILKGAFVTGSEVQRWGLGVVQEIELSCHACLCQMAASGDECRYRRPPDHKPT